MLLLVASFATLVPGGPVETRDFSALGGTVFWGFNVFLVALGLIAIAAGITLVRGSLGFAWLAIAASWGYVFVVLLDLGAVFPRSPDPIPLLLGLIESLDFMLAAYVAALCHRALGHI
ncbi:hypothetical protein AWJ14_04370 [Hoeflea olei]|uniref:DUF8051 domain-containing protein n=1 Tax=Hoeflea olei TaxID=1480615 RepID=A0A1C1Z0A8_9HYPH|nr:hypothetical protein AWJ14_04370 [Hoeflea olei]